MKARRLTIGVALALVLLIAVLASGVHDIKRRVHRHGPFVHGYVTERRLYRV